MSQTTNGLVSVLANALVNLRTSTNYDGNHTQANACLNYSNSKDTSRFDGSEAWCASILNDQQFIVAGSSTPLTFVALAIQGRGDTDQWVKTFKVRYSLDNVTWSEYRGGAALNGNTDRNTVVTHFFDSPIRARSIAIHPLTWNNHISLRFELYSQKALSTFTQIGQVETNQGGALNSGSGERVYKVPVTFATPFHGKPLVALTLDAIDATADKQVRINVQPEDITEKGFNAVFKTWNSSLVYFLRCDYVATIQE